MLAPNSPLREAITALATDTPIITVSARPEPEEDTNNAKRSPPPRYLCAMLNKRIYQAFPLLCSLRSGEIRLIAATNDEAVIRKILVYLGEPHDPPRFALAMNRLYGILVTKRVKTRLMLR